MTCIKWYYRPAKSVGPKHRPLGIRRGPLGNYRQRSFFEDDYHTKVY